jgi:hypothetical protein
MCETDGPSFTATEWEALDLIGQRLRAEGWAKHVTVARLIESWTELARSVDRCDLTIDEYTNEVTSRDALELALAYCEEPLRGKLLSEVQRADRDFQARTEGDKHGDIGRFFRLDSSSGWWWRRRPVKGPLAAFLDEYTSR